ncbi:MAG: hypothetical protein LBR80_09880 [Deltaproteobacteria bacterium]|jgi:hypothetical protein|nr:hypothetical protein [Deltaproteobacteria bacterium]
MSDDGSEKNGCAFWIVFGIILTIGFTLLRIFGLLGFISGALLGLIAWLLASPFQKK